MAAVTMCLVSHLLAREATTMGMCSKGCHLSCKIRTCPLFGNCDLFCILKNITEKTKASKIGNRIFQREKNRLAEILHYILMLHFTLETWFTGITWKTSSKFYFSCAADRASSFLYQQ